MRDGKGLDELDDGKVPHGFGGDCGGDFYGDRYLVINNFRFEFVCVARHCVFRLRRVHLRR